MIELDGVSLTFGDVTVLDGVDLTVEHGELLALVGPNGAGKTTLLRLLNGVIEPDAGRVTVDGRAVESYAAKALSRTVATVPQDTHLGFSFPARQVVEMGRTPHRSRLDWSDDADPVERALERTETTHLADRDVGDLSGGERQRILLARALAQEADCLLLDEPTANLDINHQLRVLELVAEQVDDGKTAVAAIHDIDLAARYCDRIALLADGAIRACGPPEAVLGSDAVEAAFGVETAVSTDPAAGTPRVTAVPETTERSGRVHILGHGENAAAAVRTLRAAGYELSVGPVPAGDVTAAAADALDVPVVTAAAFSEPGKDVRARVIPLLEESDALVTVGGQDHGWHTSVSQERPNPDIRAVLGTAPTDIQGQSGTAAVSDVRGDGGNAEVVRSLPALVAAVHEHTGAE